ncbi:MAG: hypothetical protein JXB60_02280 [Candidatus Cloacimonetes bacterium]|nr:hypothetical protein [Candidatus Cloacimonadota bacterium]
MKKLYIISLFRTFARGEIMRCVSTLLLLVATVFLGGVVHWVEGPGCITAPASRDSLLFYHNNSVDLFWYSNEEAEYIWAVRFDLNAYDPGRDSLQFVTQGLYIYLYTLTPGAELKVKLAVNEVNQPGADLFPEVTVNAVMGWNFLPLPAVTVNDFWVLVDYETDDEENFLASSAGDGTHSYYFEGGFYRNMYANGYLAEFLFTLTGSFIYPDDNIELVEFTLFDENGPPLDLSDVLYPVCTIWNHAAVTADSITILIQSSIPGSIQTDTLFINQLLPDELYIIDTSGQSSYAQNLLAYPSQYRFKANLICDEDNYNVDNEEIIEFNTFNIPYSSLLIENMVALEQNSYAVWSAQAQIVDPATAHVLNCFPDYLDEPFYCQDALLRFYYYDLNTYPATLVGGKHKLLGYLDDFYEERLETCIDSFLIQERTFLEMSSIEYTCDDSSGNYTIDLLLANSSSLVFSSFLNSCTLFATLIEDSLQTQREDVHGSVLLNILAEYTCQDLEYETIQSFPVLFSLENDIQPIQAIENCRFLFWVQNETDKKVYFHYLTPYLPDIDFQSVSGEEHLISQEEWEVIVCPNPLQIGLPLNIMLNTRLTFENAVYRMYNIRGQLIAELNVEGENARTGINWETSSFRDISSGIYLLNTQLRSEQRILDNYTKLVLINNR